MILLILGILLWVLAHLFKRIAPEKRAAMGAKGRGPVAIGVGLGLICMILGYRWAPFVNVWYPPAFFTHINNLLMLLAVFAFAISESKGALKARFRHPQLSAVILWGIAHLMVNGDLASVLLFGSMLLWAVAEIVLINRAGPWERPAAGSPKRDLITLAATIVAFVVITLIHGWIGPSPFPG
ncbi:NnrU family protein [Maritimibacter alkaliphilus]|uniref:NnrU family protein n=1 Tax=Maritimibacter alkaliphilus TaxID=404236 RepID=UPI001C967CD3|nr:NnrU family protein [Maritimibacter alkaliphilus]MBY6091968.1 NnrU family protein [Maritimibacter alkaliphilus]